MVCSKASCRPLAGRWSATRIGAAGCRLHLEGEKLVEIGHKRLYREPVLWSLLLLLLELLLLLDGVKRHAVLGHLVQLFQHSCPTDVGRPPHLGPSRWRRKPCQGRHLRRDSSIGSWSRALSCRRRRPGLSAFQAIRKLVKESLRGQHEKQKTKGVLHPLLQELTFSAAVTRSAARLRFERLAITTLPATASAIISAEPVLSGFSRA